jgi:hypothetical protein
MFRQMLFVQWKYSRDLLAFFIVIGFAVPLMILWFVLPQLHGASTRELMEVGQAIGWFSLALAVLAGGTIAAQGYSADERGGHTYALSLPITRSRFLAVRAAAAFAILALPALGVWLGGALAAAQVALPATLRSYSGSLALRMLLAAWLAHSCMFALRYAAGRRAKMVLFVLCTSLVAVLIVAGVAPGTRDLIARAGDSLVTHPGPFGIFFGRWTLFDV